VIHRDVTGVQLQFTREQIEALVDAMPPEHRQLARELAEAIAHPHEIWQAWMADEGGNGQWRNVRSYLRFLDLSESGLGVPFGVAVVQFGYKTNWELASVGLVLGTQDEATDRLNTIRQGCPEYSTQQH
jgi:hypothetical protein